MIDKASTAPPARMRRWGWIALIVALVLAAWGITSRLSARESLAKQAQAEAVPTVNVVQPTPAPAFETLALPGSLQAFTDAPIYARTSGYLKKWYADIGTRVHAGQVLADIDAPDLDQQLRQAEADLRTAQANNALAQTTAERWRGLLATDSVSKQDADEKFGDAAAKTALVASASANVQRLRELEGFKRIIAPFDGIVTARSTDIGALIVAGSNAGPALFHVAADHVLRVYVSVPQRYAAAIKPGVTAELTLPDQAGKTFSAMVVSTADSIDPANRTLLTQLQVDNAANILFPGAYTEVLFKIAGNGNALRVPSNTLLFGTTGLSVVTVQPDNHLLLRQIQMGRDFGTQVEVLSGLSASDRVVVNPPDSAANGMLVRLAAPPAAAGQGHKS